MMPVCTGNSAGVKQVLAANLRRIHLQFLRSDIQHAFHDEHAFRAACAAHGSDHHFVGEDHADLGVEIRYPVIVDRMGLGIQRNGHPVGVIGTGIVIEDVLESQDGAVFLEGDLAIVNLVALGGRSQEILAAILDPFDRPVEFHRDPGQKHIIGLRGHHLGAKTAANERVSPPAPGYPPIQAAQRSRREAVGVPGR